MSRDDLLTTNANIMKSVAEAVKEYAPNSIVIIISNPLDAMVYAVAKIKEYIFCISKSKFKVINKHI